MDLSYHLTLLYLTSSSPMCKIEVPERLIVSHQALIKCGLADRCVPVPVREATDEEILFVHRSDFSPTLPTRHKSLSNPICLQNLQNVQTPQLHEFPRQWEVPGGSEKNTLHDSWGSAAVHSAIWWCLLPPGKAAAYPKIILLKYICGYARSCFIHPSFKHYRTSTTVPSWLQGRPCSSWTASWQGRWGTAWLWSG